MELRVWDFENDIVNTTCEPLFSSEERRPSQYMGSAYAVNTQTGIYYQTPRDGMDLYYDFICVNREGSCICMEEMVVAASDMNNTAVIIHEKNSGNNYLMDTRGILFLLDSNVEDMDPAQYRFKLDKKTGFYNIVDRDGNVRWLLRAKSKREMFAFMINSAADSSLLINPDFLTMLKKRNAAKYLYLTLPRNKKGLKEAWLLCKLDHEVVPNVFTLDDSVNIRVPYSSENTGKMEFHYLDSKHESTLSINGLSVKTVIACLDLDWKLKEKEGLFLLPKPTEKNYAAGVSIINTLKEQLSVTDDTELYKSFFKKILKKFENGEVTEYLNYFEAIRVPYPNDAMNREDFLRKKEAYKQSNEKRKEALAEFEEQVFGKMPAGFKFPY